MAKTFSENVYGSMCLYLTVFVQHVFTSPISIVKVSLWLLFSRSIFHGESDLTARMMFNSGLQEFTTEGHWAWIM